MKKYCFSIIFLVCLSCRVWAINVDFKLDAVPLSKAIAMIYDDVLQKPYMLDPALVNDDRLVSFKTTSAQDFEQFTKRYFTNMNIRISTKNGVDYLQLMTPQKVLYKYKPVYRTPEELASVATDKSAVSFTSDYLFYDAEPEQVAKFKQMMANADIPRKSVVLRGYLYATTQNKTSVNALTGLVNLLTGKLNYKFEANVSQGYLSLSSSTLTALLPLLDSSSEYRQLSSPISKTLSGKQVTLKVGSSTPVLSGTTTNDGIVTQNIEYRDSGLVWRITPTVFANRVELDFYQSDSTFKATETGVNNTPTLDNRSLTTTVSMRSGDVVVLAGYGLDEKTKKSEGWGFLSGKSDTINRSDFVLLLQAIVE
ncbi:hypothetical protein BKK56_03660 [Rodentibacter genomosp. 2]|uniref:type II secretion system protein GspD n=1 Tax=Rodentibacter genomosp. 2 TaxID=1908266 RepID=UPI00098490E3|nr:hypothetical protein BKK56_03660 [Rodentibacter genomosp. 2]